MTLPGQRSIGAGIWPAVGIALRQPLTVLLGPAASLGGPDPSWKPLRQVIESINESFKGQLASERHQARLVERGR